MIDPAPLAYRVGRRLAAVTYGSRSPGGAQVPAGYRATGAVLL